MEWIILKSEMKKDIIYDYLQEVDHQSIVVQHKREY